MAIHLHGTLVNPLGAPAANAMLKFDALQASATGGKEVIPGASQQARCGADGAYDIELQAGTYRFSSMIGTTDFVTHGDFYIEDGSTISTIDQIINLISATSDLLSQLFVEFNDFTSAMNGAYDELVSKIGWVDAGEWSTNPTATKSNEYFSYAGTNQRFRPLSLPYDADSSAHANPNDLLPDPSTGYAGELVDVSDFTDQEQVIALIKTTGPEVFGNTVVVKGTSGSATVFRQNPNDYTADKATRIYIEPQSDVIDEDNAVGGVFKIFSVPFTDVGPSRYQDLGFYYSSGQNGDKGYYGKGVFYLNSKALGVNNPDVALTFQDGAYQAWKSTLLPSTAEGGNRAVTIFGKRNSTTAHALDNCEIEMYGWVGFDNTNSGLAWWGANGNFENRVNCFVDSGKNAYQVTLGGNKAIKHNGQVFEVCNVDGAVSFSLDLSGTDQGALFQTRVVGRQASTNAVALSVAGLNSLVLNYSGATTLTELRDGVEGQCVTILSGNSNATVAHNANIRLKKGSDFNLPAESAIQLVYSGSHSKWFEVGSSA